MDSQQILEQIYQEHNRLLAAEMRDAEVYMHPDTIKQMARDLGMEPGNVTDLGIWLYGMPVKSNGEMPIGTVEVMTEGEMDRAIRRATDCPPPPTVKSLLRHWAREIKRRIKR